MEYLALALALALALGLGFGPFILFFWIKLGFLYNW